MLQEHKGHSWDMDPGVVGMKQRGCCQCKRWSQTSKELFRLPHVQNWVDLGSRSSKSRREGRQIPIPAALFPTPEAGRPMLNQPKETQPMIEPTLELESNLLLQTNPCESSILCIRGCMVAPRDLTQHDEQLRYSKPKDNEIKVTLFTPRGKVVLMLPLFASSSLSISPRHFRVVLAGVCRGEQSKMQWKLLEGSLMCSLVLGCVSALL